MLDYACITQTKNTEPTPQRFWLRKLGVALGTHPDLFSFFFVFFLFFLSARLK